MELQTVLLQLRSNYLMVHLSLSIDPPITEITREALKKARTKVYKKDYGFFPFLSLW